MKLVGVVGVMWGLAGACINESSVTCSDGTVCPAGTTCTALTDPAETLCATPGQLDACTGKAEGDACATGWCHDGACLTISCGNGRVDLGEVCDDHNVTSGDGCSSDCTSNETCGNGKLDPLRLASGLVVPNEQCDDGNLVSGDGCSSRCVTETPSWSQLAVQALPPLSQASMTYDPSRNRIVLFGGVVHDLAGHEIPSNAVYEYNGAAWINVPTPVSPAGRQKPAFAYDGVTHHVLMFGGHVGDDRAALGDTWAWDGSTWTLLRPATSPSPRTEAAMAYDSKRQRVVLFGGFTGTGELDDTWEWDGSSWTQIATPTRPMRRYAHVMAYDPKRARIVMAGGAYSSPPGAPRDTWEYDGHDWTRVNGSTPMELDEFSTMAYDTAGSRIIACTGRVLGGLAFNNITYAFDGSTWTDLGLAGPNARAHGAIAANPRDGTLVMYGGEDGSAQFLVSTYKLAAGTWVLAADPPAISQRQFAAATNDPMHRRVWLFGGQDAAGPSNELWSYDGTTWTRYSANPSPSARIGASLAYDAKHDRLVLFGGGATANNPVPIAAETWLWDGAAWTKATPSASPTGRFGAGMVYDTKLERVVLFGGGIDAAGNGNGETWMWDGASWQQVTGAGPTARALPVMAYDAAAGEIVVQGGLALPDTLNDVWSFDGTAWTKRAADAYLPARFFGASGYDPARRAVTLFGGFSPGGASFGDTWSWNHTTFDLVATDVSPSPRVASMAFADPRGHGLIVFDGVSSFDTNVLYDETWRLDYRSSTPSELCTIDIDYDGDGLKGCEDPDCWAVCTPLCPPGAACPATAPRCGDGTCQPDENCRMCPGDCGGCAPACGDTFCDPGETAASCPGDC